MSQLDELVNVSHISEVLTELKEAGVYLFLKDGKLNFKSTQSKLPNQLRELIIANKPKLISFLKEKSAVSDSSRTKVSKNNISDNQSFLASKLQKQFWYEHQLDDTGFAYNIAFKVIIGNSYSKENLLNAFDHLFARHTALRTVFNLQESGELQQTVLPLDVKAMPVAFVEKIDDHPAQFCLSKLPLIKVQCKLTESKTELYVDCHHIILDGTSIEIFCDQLYALLDIDSEISDDIYQYIDFSEYEKLMGEGAYELQRKFWLSEFEYGIPSFEFPFDLNGDVNSYSGKNHEIDIPRELSLNINKFFDTHQGVTKFSFYLAIYALMLRVYLQSDNIVIGIPVSKRKLPEGSDTLGVFVNTLPLNVRFQKGDTFLSLLETIQNKVMQIQDSSSLVAEDLNKLLNAAKGSPIFNTIFMLDEALPCQQNRSIEFFDRNIAKLPVTLAIKLSDQPKLIIEYRDGCMTQVMASQVASNYLTLLSNILEDSSANILSYSLLSDNESRRCLYDLNDTQSDFYSKTVLHELFESSCQSFPKAVAIYDSGERYTYSDLNEYINKLANYLLKLGVAFGDKIAIYLPRSMDAVASMLAVLKLGAVFVPLDDQYPLKRITDIVTDSSAKYILSNKELSDNVGCYSKITLVLEDLKDRVNECSSKSPNIKVGLSDLAYIIYTSGSTGKPKGVMIDHLGISHYIQWAVDYYEVEKGVGSPLHSSLGFDLTITSIFAPLSCGKAIYILGKDEGVEGLAAMLIDEPNFSLIKITPAHLRLLESLIPSDKVQALHATIVIGGEALFAKDIELWHSLNRQLRFVNEYGATETSVADTIYEVLDELPLTPTIPVGKAISNSQMYVFDDQLKPLPCGVVGEIYLSGIGLSPGYLNLPEKTSEKFVDHPYRVGEKLYKTGDLGRLLFNGHVEFVARIDDQVKLNGYRVELGEIRSVIESLDDINSCYPKVMILNGKKVLVAYLISEYEKINSAELYSELKNLLPNYMLPKHFIQIEQAPLTINGKVDYSKLPIPSEADLTSSSDYIEPTSANEKILCQVWSELFKLDKVSVADNFFALGGDSILSIQLLAKMRKKGLQFSTRDLFKAQTIAELALLDKSTNDRAPQSSLKMTKFKFSPIQKWFIENNHPKPNHFNQAFVFKLSSYFDFDFLSECFLKLIDAHPMLAAKVNGEFQECCAEFSELSLLEEVRYNSDIAFDLWIESQVESMQTVLNLESGPVLRAKVIRNGPSSEDLIAIVIHHWSIDGVSWRILADDFSMLLSKEKIEKEVVNYADYINYVDNNLASFKYQYFDYWRSIEKGCHVAWHLTDDCRDEFSFSDYSMKSFSISKDLTSGLLLKLETAHKGIQLALAGSIMMSLANIKPDLDNYVIDFESHGRLDELDLSRTVGWFTAIYPELFSMRDLKNSFDKLSYLLGVISNTPSEEVSYQAMKLASNDGQLTQQPEILINYLGSFENTKEDGLLSFTEYNVGVEIDSSNKSPYVMIVNVMLDAGMLKVNLLCNSNIVPLADLDCIINQFEGNITSLVENFCEADEIAGYKNMNQARIEAVYPASLFQQDAYKYESQFAKSGQFVTQIIWDLTEGMDLENFKTRWQMIVDKFFNLRLGFAKLGSGEVLQVVHKNVLASFFEYDYSSYNNQMQSDALEKLLQNDKLKGFALDEIGFSRLTFVKLAGQGCKVVWTHHHIILDGWSVALILDELNTQDNRYISSGPNDYLSRIIPDNYWDNLFHAYNKPVRFFENKSLSRLIYHQKKLAIKLQVESSLYENLKSLAHSLSITLSALLQFAFSLLLSHISQRNDVAFLTISSGRRHITADEVDSLVGCFIQYIPLRHKLDNKQSVCDSIVNFHEQFLTSEESIANYNMGYDIFDALFIYENFPHDSEFKKLEFRSDLNFPLTFVVLEGETLEFAFDYYEDFITSEQAKYSLDVFFHMLNMLLNDSKINTEALLSKFKLPVFGEVNTSCALPLLSNPGVDPGDNILLKASDGVGAPIIFFHPSMAGSEVYLNLVSSYSIDNPLYLVDSFNLYSEVPQLNTICDLSEYYLELIVNKLQATSVYLAGWSMGGMLAYEVAQKAKRRGIEVKHLFMLDSYSYFNYDEVLVNKLKSFIYKRVSEKLDAYSDSDFNANLEYLYNLEARAIAAYQPEPLNQGTTLFKASKEDRFTRLYGYIDDDLSNGWSTYINQLNIIPVECDHYGIIEKTAIQVILNEIKRHVKESTFDNYSI